MRAISRGASPWPRRTPRRRTFGPRARSARPGRRPARLRSAAARYARHHQSIPDASAAAVLRPSPPAASHAAPRPRSASLCRAEARTVPEASLRVPQHEVLVRRVGDRPGPVAQITMGLQHSTCSTRIRLPPQPAPCSRRSAPRFTYPGVRRGLRAEGLTLRRVSLRRTCGRHFSPTLITLAM